MWHWEIELQVSFVRSYHRLQLPVSSTCTLDIFRRGSLNLMIVSSAIFLLSLVVCTLIPFPLLFPHPPLFSFPPSSFPFPPSLLYSTSLFFLSLLSSFPFLCLSHLHVSLLSLFSSISPSSPTFHFSSLHILPFFMPPFSLLSFPSSLTATKLYWQVARLRAMMTLARLTLSLPEDRPLQWTIKLWA